VVIYLVLFRSGNGSVGIAVSIFLNNFFRGLVITIVSDDLRSINTFWFHCSVWLILICLLLILQSCIVKVHMQCLDISQSHDVFIFHLSYFHCLFVYVTVHRLKNIGKRDIGRRSWFFHIPSSTLWDIIIGPPSFNLVNTRFIYMKISDTIAEGMRSLQIWKYLSFFCQMLFASTSTILLALVQFKQTYCQLSFCHQ